MGMPTSCVAVAVAVSAVAMATVAVAAVAVAAVPMVIMSTIIGITVAMAAFMTVTMAVPMSTTCTRCTASHYQFLAILPRCHWYWRRCYCWFLLSTHDGLRGRLVCKAPWASFVAGP
mmetsp:Transcript_65811/g.122747  ORF Transcript_65811/g.122747 Transcript_65811/m.122747 type:complete len:117 (+) Transcript_65811:2244-2594(+)